MTALGRIARRALLLGGGAVVGWLLSALLHSPSAAATPVPIVPALPASSPLSGVLSSLTPVVPAIEKAAPVTSPILGPVESLLRGTPIGGRVGPLLAPIQGPSTVSDPTGVLLIAPVVHPAEPTGALLMRAPGTAARAMMAKSPGSVPGDPVPPLAPTAPKRLPDQLLLPPVPGTPVVPPEPLTGSTGDPAGTSGSGSPHRTDTDRELPFPGAPRSQSGSRSPPESVIGTRQDRADDPSFAPD